MKKIIIIFAAVLAMGVTVHAAAMPISMPYVPPMEVHVYDALFNASGVTAIGETDEVKRLNAYLNLFAMALGAGAENFLEEMADVVDIAKTTAQIKMSSEIGAQLQEAIKYAMEVGYELEGGGDISFTQADVENKINARAHELWNTPNINAQNLTAIADYLYNGGSLVFYAAGGYLVVSTGDFSNVTSNSFFASYTRTVYYRSGMWSWANYFNTQFNVEYLEYYETLEDFMTTGTRQKVVAKDIATEQAISAGKNAILTADSALTENEVIDTTKPIIINIYRTISYPATSAEDIEEKQRELVVTNISTDEVATTEKAELAEARTEAYGDTEEYKLDLMGFFPFCIPRDIMLLLQAFSAEAETPEFDIPFPTWENGEMATTGYHISLAQFDNLAGALRAFQCVAFMIGLLAVTRQKYLRG